MVPTNVDGLSFALDLDASRERVGRSHELGYDGLPHFKTPQRLGLIHCS
jgi:hypothetical protein